MKIFEQLNDFRKFRAGNDRFSLGFVPTMGALHTGHLELVRRSKRENEKTAVSIFVNPTQFNDPKDFEKYPKTFDADQSLLRESGADFLIYPTPEQMYPDSFKYSLDECDFSTKLCGAHRPGHFKGVLTVVMKLLNGVDADHAYFGEKDFQQLKLIQGMADAFFVKTEIVGCSTVREEDGLAMSSRNTRLTAEQRKIAPALFAALNSYQKAFQSGYRQAGESSSQSFESLRKELTEQLNSKGFTSEYFEEHYGRIFVAAKLGEVRLIDNVKL